MGEASYPKIIPVIVLYFMVLMGVAPLTTQVHIEQACEALESDDCDDSEVSARASNLNLIAALAHYIPAIFTCGIYGNIADIYGRKRALVFPIIGLGLFSTGYFIISTFEPSSYFYIIVASNFCLGLSGSYMSFLMASLCYVADCTIRIPTSRKRAYSVTEASIFASQIISPVLSGIWASYYGYSVPCLCGIVLCASALFYTFFIPESLPLDAVTRQERMKYDVFQTFKNLSFLFQYQTPHGSSPLPYIGSSFFLFFMVSIAYGTVKIVYLRHRFGWNSAQIGVYDGFEGLLIMLSMLLAPGTMRKVTDYLSLPPLPIITWIQIGYLARATYFLLFGSFSTSLLLLFSLPCLLLVGPLAPYNRTILSNSVPHKHQAQAFSSFSAVEGVSALFAPLFSGIYSFLVVYNKSHYIFILMTFLICISFLLLCYLRYNPDISCNLPSDREMRESMKNQSGLRSISYGEDFREERKDQLEKLLGESEHDTGKEIEEDVE